MPEDVRILLQGRRRHLVASLEHRNEGAVRHSIDGCLGMYGNVNAVRLRAYTMALCRMAPWAIREACHMISAGDVAGVSKTFAPKAAEIKQVALALVEPHYAELARLRRVLEALPYRPVDLAAVARLNAMIAAWRDRTDPRAKSLAQAVDTGKNLQRDIVAAANERLRARLQKDGRQVAPPAEFEEF